MAGKRFAGSLLTWPIRREGDPFRVYVVEPRVYQPTRHAEIFGAAITALVSPPADRVGDSQVSPAQRLARAGFDLVTFPEAFLPWQTLIQFLGSLSSVPVPIGCVHVGLRTEASADTHLLPLAVVHEFAEQLRKVPNVVGKDLAPFLRWLNAQTEGHFNLGCLLTIDANAKTRVCVHPKMVRSPYELSPHPEGHMKEANLVSLVTLRPKNANLPTVTIQPLICSDMLSLTTDRPVCYPLEAVNTDAHCLGKNVPDHVDVVSVAACTPQYEILGSGDRRWRLEFRESFVRTSSDDHFGRQNQAVFVLANYSVFPGKARPAGLSGAFVPLPVEPGEAALPAVASRLLYGRFPNADQEPDWAPDQTDREKGAPMLGHLVTLRPGEAGVGSLATLFGFTVNRLPRRACRWRRNGRLVEVSAYEATEDASGIRLERRSSS